MKIFMLFLTTALFLASSVAGPSWAASRSVSIPVSCTISTGSQISESQLTALVNAQSKFDMAGKDLLGYNGNNMMTDVSISFDKRSLTVYAR